MADCLCGYAVANRAPTPAELSCADPPTRAAWPTSSSAIRTFSRSYRTPSRQVCAAVPAVRGTTPAAIIAFFRSTLDNDIAFINSVTSGSCASSRMSARPFARASMSTAVEDRPLARLARPIPTSMPLSRAASSRPSGDNPAADADGNVTVRSGNQLPGIPANQLKFGVDYRVTDTWTVGGTGIAASSAFLFGDEANLNPPMPGIFRDELEHDISG